jgi:hypothetical protein
MLQAEKAILVLNRDFKASFHSKVTRCQSRDTTPKPQVYIGRSVILPLRSPQKGVVGMEHRF